MKMNIAEVSLQMLLLLPVSFLSAAAVSNFVPPVGAVEVPTTEEKLMESDVSNAVRLKSGSEAYNERIVQSQWEKQRRWAAVYKARRRELHWARLAKLSFISTGAIMQVAATQVPTGWKAATAVVGGALTALGGVIKSQYITQENVGQMVKTYYIAQAMKSEVVKFRTKCFPYDKNKSDAVQLLRDTCNALSKSGNDRRYHITPFDSKPIPTEMSTKWDYLEKRLNPRIHQNLIPRARKMAAKAKLCSRVEDGFIGAGTCIGFLSTQSLPGNAGNIVGKLTGWAAAFTTVSAAFANHAAKMKFDEISESYFDTADQLSEIVETWPVSCEKAGDPGWDDQIAKVENLILSVTEEFARKRTGNMDLTFGKPPNSVREKQMWNPNVICGDDESGSYSAKDRALWLVENQGMDMKTAQQQVMAEFPDNF